MRVDDAVCSHLGIGQPATDSEHVAEHVAFMASPKNELFTKLRYRSRDMRHAIAHVVHAAAGPGVKIGIAALNGLNRWLKLRYRVCRGPRERDSGLHGSPQRVGVEHVARKARHDVGPVAGLVLQQPEETLVLLAFRPRGSLRLIRSRAATSIGGARRAQPCRGAASWSTDGDQPPQRGVDAAQIPVSRPRRPWGRRTSESGRWRLMACKRQQTRGCFIGGIGIAGHGHAERADSRASRPKIAV